MADQVIVDTEQGFVTWSVKLGKLTVSGNRLPPDPPGCLPIGVAIEQDDGKLAGVGLTLEQWDELVARVALMRLGKV